MCDRVRGQVGEALIGDQAMRALTTVYLEAGETVTFTASEATELLHFGLPNLAGLRMPSHEQVHVEAAE